MKFIITAFYCCVSIALCAQNNATTVSSPISHAPIGVMGDHLHKKGEVMFSYRFMRMNMNDNLIGSDEVSLVAIATSVPNMFAGMEGMPPTLRVVPTNMTMNMHMLGVMYAPSDWITLMGMGMYLQNDMDLITIQGGSGTTELGTFSTNTSGIGDVKLSALIKLVKKEANAIHLNVGISLPTGSIKETSEVLTPMNMRPTVRAPYPMQLGSGSFDFLPGVTYSRSHEKFGWGGQLSGTLRLTDNKEDYRFGNKLDVSTWASYRISSWLSSSIRPSFSTVGQIKGQDDDIMLPVQTAHPAFQGGETINVALGVNMIGQSGFVKNQRLALEYGVPVYQNLNGPQMKAISVMTLGWQYAF